MKKIIFTLITIFCSIALFSCKNNQETSEQTESFSYTEALEDIKLQYGESDPETGALYDWQYEDIVEVDGTQYYNFSMYCQMEETDAQGTVIDTYSEYVINILVSLETQEIFEARENTNTHTMEIQY